MFHRCHPIIFEFVWELTKETINLPLGCRQGGLAHSLSPRPWSSAGLQSNPRPMPGQDNGWGRPLAERGELQLHPGTRRRVPRAGGQRARRRLPQNALAAQRRLRPAGRPPPPPRLGPKNPAAPLSCSSGGSSIAG